MRNSGLASVTGSAAGERQVSSWSSPEPVSRRLPRFAGSPDPGSWTTVGTAAGCAGAAASAPVSSTAAPHNAPKNRERVDHRMMRPLLSAPIMDRPRTPWGEFRATHVTPAARAVSSSWEQSEREEDRRVNHASLFAEHRSTMVGAAYRVLGSLHDAEDVVQDVWPRWEAVDLDAVRAPRAYLVQAATRQALNRLREQQRRREEYVGPWLPEPVGDVTRLGAEGEVETAESVSMAMLVVLASLSPLERATFVLKEVFDLPYAEIAETLDRSESAVRQLAHRARSHVHARAPRHAVDAAAHRKVTQAFLAAVQGGSLEDLLVHLSPDVVLITDGGGLKKAALRPVHGVEKVLRFGLGVLAKPDMPTQWRAVEVNGLPGIAGFFEDGTLDSGDDLLSRRPPGTRAVHGAQPGEAAAAAVSAGAIVEPCPRCRWTSPARSSSLPTRPTPARCSAAT
jgi:RNA polymerase sigma-70 factor (ECF subfamily)